MTRSSKKKMFDQFLKKQVRVLHDYIAAEKGVLSLRLGEVPFLPQS